MLGIDRSPCAASPYKGLRPRPHSVPSTAPRNQALDAPASSVEIQPRPKPLRRAVRALGSFPGRIEPRGELASLSSTRPYARLDFWCSESGGWRAPLSSTAVFMVNHRVGEEEAGRPAAWLPLLDPEPLDARSRDRNRSYPFGCETS